MAEKILNKISFGESAVDVYLITDSAARAHMADSAVHVTAADKSSWNGKQDAITSASKLDYSLLANTPSIPAVNSAVVTISQGGVSKGSFNVNASSDVSINLDAGGGGTTPMLAVRMPYYNDGNYYHFKIEGHQKNVGFWSSVFNSTTDYAKVMYCYDNNHTASMTSSGISSERKNVIVYIDISGVISDNYDRYHIAWNVAGSTTYSTAREFLLPCSPIMGGDEGGAGEANIIEAITFNGSAVTVTDKTAAISATIPSALSALTDDVAHRLVTDTEKATWNGKQNAITSSSKLDYSLIDNAPSIPTVNNAVVTISQGGVSKGSFNVNAASNVSIDLDAGGGAGEANIIEAITFNGTSATVTNKVAAITASIPTVNSPKITINQGGASKGSFNLNQPGSSTINLDAPGESNVIEAVQLNGTNLSISNKSVNVQAITGITVNGTVATVANGVAAITVTGGGGGEGGITLAQARRQALIFG